MYDASMSPYVWRTRWRFVVDRVLSLTPYPVHPGSLQAALVWHSPPFRREDWYGSAEESVMCEQWASMELVASFQESRRCAPWPWCRARVADEGGAVRKMRGTPWQRVGRNAHDHQKRREAPSFTAGMDRR